MGELRIMGRPGDTKLIWDIENEAETENAKRTFDDLVAKGFTGFEVKGRKGEKGERMAAFDADAGAIIMVPRLAGG